MDDTCVGHKCWFYGLIKSLTNNDPEMMDIKNCPFYTEMIFTPAPIGGKVESAKLIKDCVNKRSLLIMLEEVYPRVLGVQKSQEEMRNSTDKATVAFKEILSIFAESQKIQNIENRNVVTIDE